MNGKLSNNCYQVISQEETFLIDAVNEENVFFLLFSFAEQYDQKIPKYVTYWQDRSGNIFIFWKFSAFQHQFLEVLWNTRRWFSTTSEKKNNFLVTNKGILR